MAKITFENVNYTYKNGDETFDALRDVSFDVHEGEILCLVGHSGCGKSTILNLLAGLIRPSSGRILIDGALVAGPGPDRSIVFQNYSLFPWQTAQKNVAFSIRQTHKNMTRKEALERALDYLDQVKMKDAATRYPFQLSGGMRQRVAIARALGQDAPVMLLDEPFGALDMHIRKQLQSLLLDLWKSAAKQGRAKTAIFVTHDIDEAIFLADRIIFMRPREIVQTFEMPRARVGAGVGEGSGADAGAGSGEIDVDNKIENEDVIEIKNKIEQLFSQDAEADIESEVVAGTSAKLSATTTSEEAGE